MQTCHKVLMLLLVIGVALIIAGLIAIAFVVEMTNKSKYDEIASQVNAIEDRGFDTFDDSTTSRDGNEKSTLIEI